MRVSIARALITQPQVLFMDEPFSALDEPTRLNLQDELKQIQQRFGMTILFVTHSFYEAAFLGDRVFILSSEKPARIVYDKNNSTDFLDRFEPAYQEKVKEISRYFSRPKKQHEIF